MIQPAERDMWDRKSRFFKSWNCFHMMEDMIDMVWVLLLGCQESDNLIITSFEGWMYSVAGFLTSSSTGGFIVSPSSWKSFGFPRGTFWNVFTMRHHTTLLWAFAASSFTAALYALDKSRPALRMIAIIPQSWTNDDNREDPQITRVLLPRRPDHDWESLVDLSGRSTQNLLHTGDAPNAALGQPGWARLWLPWPS